VQLKDFLVDLSVFHNHFEIPLRVGDQVERSVAKNVLTSTDHSSFDFDQREVSEQEGSLESCQHLPGHRLSQ
jgi:hypothetical protein